MSGRGPFSVSVESPLSLPCLHLVSQAGSIILGGPLFEDKPKPAIEHILVLTARAVKRLGWSVGSCPRDALLRSGFGSLFPANATKCAQTVSLCCFRLVWGWFTAGSSFNCGYRLVWNPRREDLRAINETPKRN